MNLTVYKTLALGLIMWFDKFSFVPGLTPRTPEDAIDTHFPHLVPRWAEEILDTTFISLDAAECDIYYEETIARTLGYNSWRNEMGMHHSYSNYSLSLDEDDYEYAGAISLDSNEEDSGNVRDENRKLLD